MSKFITVHPLNRGTAFINVDKIERIDVDTTGNAIITLPQSRFTTEETYLKVLDMVMLGASVPKGGVSP